MSNVIFCKGCDRRIEPPDEAVRVSRREPLDIPGQMERGEYEQPGFVHRDHVEAARAKGWRPVKSD